MTRRRKKPSKPGERKLIEVSPERAEQQAEIIRLQRQGATVNIDPRTKRMVSAYRSNVFNLLLQRGTITQNHHDAASRLALEWATWKGLDGGPEMTGGRVDGGSGSKDLVTDRMLRAGENVREALSAIGEHATLIKVLVAETVERDRPMVWRALVQRATGESVRDRQTSRTVAALEALRSVYEGDNSQHGVAA